VSSLKAVLFKIVLGFCGFVVAFELDVQKQKFKLRRLNKLHALFNAAKQESVTIFILPENTCELRFWFWQC